MAVDRSTGAFRCYVDTSALAKRYLEEAGTDAFDAFCDRPGLDPLICPLGVTEFSSVLEIRRRLGKLSSRNIPQVWQRSLADVAAGGWHPVGLAPTLFNGAATLIRELGTPISTLDALHLACALDQGARDFATADRQLATAARKAKLRVHTF